MTAPATRTRPALAAESPPDDDADATGRRMFRQRIAKALLPFDGGEPLLSSADLAEKYKTWKAKHPGFDPMFEAVRTGAEGRTAR